MQHLKVVQTIILKPDNKEIQNFVGAINNGLNIFEIVGYSKVCKLN